MDASDRRGAGEPRIRLLCYAPPRVLDRALTALPARAQDYAHDGTATLAASAALDYHWRRHLES